jgi:stringent starvation protein B
MADMNLSFSDAAKAKQLREYFNRHGRIYIVVDATRDEVIVPEHLRGDPALRLVLNLRMPQPIHIRDDRGDSDFSFSGQIFACSIPMHTIWATYLPEGEIEQGIIWDDSVPEMIRVIVQAVRSNLSEDADETAEQPDAQSAEHDADAARRQSPTDGIPLIEGGGGSKSGDAQESDAQPRRGAHLRVVK